MRIRKIFVLMLLITSYASLSFGEIPKEIEGIRIGMNIDEIIEKYNVIPENCPSGCGEGEFYIFIHENKFFSISGKKMAFEILTRSGKVREFWVKIDSAYGLAYYKETVSKFGKPQKIINANGYAIDIWMDKETELSIHVENSDGSVSLIGLKVVGE